MKKYEVLLTYGYFTTVEVEDTEGAVEASVKAESTAHPPDGYMKIMLDAERKKD